MRTEPDAIPDDEQPTGQTPEEKAVAAPPQNKAIQHAPNKHSPAAPAAPSRRAPTPTSEA